VSCSAKGKLSAKTIRQSSFRHLKMPTGSGDGSGEVAQGKLPGERCTFKACRKVKLGDYPSGSLWLKILLRG
jgi:hypothetical protein